jgi:hypothetical protein
VFSGLSDPSAIVLSMDDETREIGCRERIGTHAWVRYPAPADLRLLSTAVARRRARRRRP